MSWRLMGSVQGELEVNEVRKGELEVNEVT